MIIPPYPHTSAMLWESRLPADGARFMAWRAGAVAALHRSVGLPVTEAEAAAETRADRGLQLIIATEEWLGAGVYPVGSLW